MHISVCLHLFCQVLLAGVTWRRERGERSEGEGERLHATRLFRAVNLSPSDNEEA